MSAPMAISLDTKADWMANAEQAITTLAAGHHRKDGTFTADDVYDIAGQPEDPHWSGTAFKAAQQRGQIAKTGVYTPSLRRARKGSILAVWKATP